MELENNTKISNNVKGGKNINNRSKKNNDFNELSIEEINEKYYKEGDIEAFSGYEIASMGTIEGPKIGGEYLIFISLDERKYKKNSKNKSLEIPHVNLVKLSDRNDLLAKIIIPNISFLKKKKELETLWIKDDFDFNQKLKDEISKWFCKIHKKIDTTNLQLCIVTWDSILESVSYRQVGFRLKRSK
jgi:hypothetical protein